MCSAAALTLDAESPVDGWSFVLQANALWYSPPLIVPPLPRLFISELQACIELYVHVLCPAASRAS